jgi:hypothetical protein
MTCQRVALVALTCIVFAAALAAAQAPPSTQPAGKAAARREDVTLAVEAAQEAVRMQLRQEAIEQFKARRSSGLMPNTEAMLSAPVTIPPPGRGWIAREINGLTFYLVPCAPMTARSSSGIKASEDSVRMSSGTVAAPTTKPAN